MDWQVAVRSDGQGSAVVTKKSNRPANTASEPGRMEFFSNDTYTSGDEVVCAGLDLLENSEAVRSAVAEGEVQPGRGQVVTESESRTRAGTSSNRRVLVIVGDSHADVDFLAEARQRRQPKVRQGDRYCHDNLPDTSA